MEVLFESLVIEELEGGDTRQVLRIKPSLAPVKAYILPLIKESHSDKALKVYHDLKEYFMVSYDDAGNIGKRYRRGDAVGIPFAITIDNTTLEDETVTIRERDTMEQTSIPIKELREYLEERTRNL